MSINKDKANKPSLLIIDGNALAHRCMHAFTNLKIKKNGKTIYTGLPYGFIYVLKIINQEIKPKHLMIVWDGGSKRRIKLYPGYKKKRMAKKFQDEILKKKNPETRSYLEEIITLYKILNNLGIQQFRTNDEEADDVIGTLVHKLYDKYKIKIYSNDHDFLQLLHYPDVSIYKVVYWKQNKLIHEIYTKKKFIKEYGFNPKYYPNVLAIGGDHTDEYPGVKGISEQSAIQLVHKYKKLDKILQAALRDKIEGRQGTLLKKHKDMAILCRKLALIIKDVEINPIKSNLNKLVLKKVFKFFKFHSFLFKDKFKEITNLSKQFINLED